MQKVDLKRVLDMLVNEEQDDAEGLLHQWFVDKTKSIHENLMQEDDIFETEDLTKGIEDDQDDIEAEEYYGEDDSDMGDEDETDGPIDADAETAAANDISGGDDNFDSDDTTGLGDPSDGSDVPADVTQMSTDPAAIQDQFADVVADIDRLKAEFAKITGMDPQGMDDTGMDDPTGADPTVPPALPSEPEESMFSESDFADLEESFELEKVTGHDLTTPEYAGAGGKFTSADNKSLALNKGPDIWKGKPVEIKSDDYKGGMKRQDSPEVKKAPLAKNQVKGSADDLEVVPPGGPKGALLNTKMTGGENDKSIARQFKESAKKK